MGFGIGWVGWKNFACRETSPRGCAVEQLLNPILLSNRDVKRSLAKVEVTCMLSHARLLQFSNSQLLEYNRLEVFLEG